MSFIRFRRVTREYRTGNHIIRALDRVDMDIEQGQFTVILGPSGSGKSTFLNLLGGMDYVTSGEIDVGEKTVSSLTEKERTLYRRRDIGFVFQFYNLIPTLTAYENVDMVSKLSENAIGAEKALEAVGLLTRADNLPSQLSGGELQRVSIARAICKNPKLLLCDEPTAALDSETGKSVLTMLQSMAEKYGNAVVLVTHNAAVAPAADRLIRLKDGKINEVANQPNPVPMAEVVW
ncbi:ABC transporter ATP-binding protein [Pseudoramibacter alactolyticus]|uniref:ABC transporter ATP-binding protein n=1 Tax=Pseudoramibacter alactolyticus TaxID=113287 RepID=UPI00248F3A9F|nr:ABC transporter ATP-binding protein [Pseudoramibacter alactolyticus]